MFEKFLFQNSNLTVVNAISKCEGRITRERTTNKRTEKAVLDFFFIVCKKILPFVPRMVIDEKGENALLKYRGGKIVKADHIMLKLELNITIHEKKEHKRIEMFNMRNKLFQKQFKDFTSNTNRFTKGFSSSESFDIKFKRWQRLFQKALQANFRKIRHKEDDNSHLSNVDLLMNKKKDILKKKVKNQKDLEDMEMLDKEITKECEEKEWEKLNNILGSRDSPHKYMEADEKGLSKKDKTPPNRC